MARATLGREGFPIPCRLFNRYVPPFMPLPETLRKELDWSQSIGEEVANSVSHGLGFLAAALGAPILLQAAWLRGSTPFLIGSCIFTGTMVLLYLRSTAYHRWPRTGFKRALQVL